MRSIRIRLVNENECPADIVTERLHHYPGHLLNLILLRVVLVALICISVIITTIALVPIARRAFSFDVDNINFHTMSTPDSYTTVSYVTTPNETVAQRLARGLVERRLAACVNIVKGVDSIYEWAGKIEQETEILLIIKSQSHKSSELTEYVQSNHPYDCPEVVTLRVDSGSVPYLNWVRDTVNKEAIQPKDQAQS